MVLPPVLTYLMRPSRFNMRNHYKVLGISKHASSTDIREAYLKLVKEWHPDLNRHTPMADEMMKMYNAAYETLSDPARRSEYDRSLQPPPEQKDREDNTAGHTQSMDETAAYPLRKDVEKWIKNSYYNNWDMNFDFLLRAHEWTGTDHSLRQLNIWRNLIVSVWLIIGFSAFQAVNLFLHPPALLNDPFYPFRSRMIMAPFMLVLIELLLWIGLFRHRKKGSRFVAGFMGILLLLRLVMVPLIITDLYGYGLNIPGLFLFLYSSLSHLGYAACGKER